MSSAIRRWRLLPPVVAAQFRKQTDNLKVQPDQRHHQAKRAVPFHVLRQPVHGAFFNHAEIEDQVQSRDDDNRQAEQNPDGSRAKDAGNLHME